MSELKVTINDKELIGRAGQTILELALENGIEIPNLCYDPRLKPTGSCRLCLVEVEGQRAPVTACTFAIADGMVIQTETDVHFCHCRWNGDPNRNRTTQRTQKNRS